MNIIDLAFISDKIKKEIFHKTKLNMSQVRLICFFENNENKPVAMGELAESLQISPSTLSRQLHQPKTASLLSSQKVANSSSKKVALNERGQDLAAELRKQLGEMNKRLTADWPQAEADSFATMVTRLRSRLEQEC